MYKNAIICFVRHGQTDWNLEGRMQGREEIPLNQNGIEQAKRSAEALNKAYQMGLKWDRVVSSPLGRAKDTANILANGANCKTVLSDERLNERDFGELSGYKYDEYSRAVYGRVDGIKTIETIESLLARTRDFIKSTVKEGERIIVVSHGALSRIFAQNTEKSDSVPENFDGTFGNCYFAFYSFDGDRIVLNGYNISPDDLCEYVKESGLLK